ncbi:5193_t:CDS:2, partial [Dentiscutata heterogama]
MSEIQVWCTCQICILYENSRSLVLKPIINTSSYIFDQKLLTFNLDRRKAQTIKNSSERNNEFVNCLEKDNELKNNLESDNEFTDWSSDNEFENCLKSDSEFVNRL